MMDARVRMVLPISPMFSGPAMDAEHLQQQNSHVRSRRQCCHCHCCIRPLGIECQDPATDESDSSTVNEVEREYPPILEHHSTRHSHAKLVRNKHAHQRPAISDPFDYEQKYPPDDEYKEMSERSRVFKTYMDECTKFDFDMVENWRNGLDMLLIFASLFSAVVTTFVVQTYQSLNVDFAQVTASLMLRLIDVQIAISQGASRDELVQNTDPATSCKAKPVDLWANGLWFTSLALSLTTTLIAVLTKQWINEYMVLPSGTPRDRARIRHFRFIGLQQWHVPLIIGLLPVLMHISLGVFFAGFIIFLCSLSYAMAKALGCVTGLGALAYLISNLLPLFFANCPYKTPLALYSFRMVSSVRQYLQSWKACHRVQSSAIARSLRDVERGAVTYQAENLDALAVSWLHNTSSNASVQSIAVQSLAGLPLQSVCVVAGSDGITTLVSNPDTWRFLDFVSLTQKDEERPAVIRAIRVHHRFEQPVDRMERMQRGALRFGAFKMLNKEEDRYQFIYSASPEPAIEAVQNSLLRPSSGVNTTYDVVLWGRLLEASMRSGLDFLNIQSSCCAAPPSPLWCQFLKCAVQHHDCSFSNCNGDDRELFSYSLGPEKFPLAITRYDLETNGTSPTLSNALITNMRPSFVKWVLHVGFPHVKRSVSDHTEHLPDDMLLVLALLQTRSIQATSSLPESLHGNRLFSDVLEAVKDYILRLGTCIRHKDIDRAALYALKAVVESEVFGTRAVMSLPDEAMIVRLLFYGLNRRYKLRSGLDDCNASWLTADLFIRIWRVTTAALELGAVYNGWEVLSYVFTYVSHFPSQQDGMEKIFAYLMQYDWLHDIGLKLTRLSKSTTPEMDRLPEMWCLGPNYIAATYLDVLAARAVSSSEVIGNALEYIAEPAHLTTLSRVLLLSDSDMQNRLWQLASILRDKSCNWPECISNLSELVSCAGMENEYEFVRLFLKFDGHGNKRLYYHRPVSELPSLVRAFSADIARKQFTLPRYIVPKSQIIEEPEPQIESSPKELGFFRPWRRSFWRDAPNNVV